MEASPRVDRQAVLEKASDLLTGLIAAFKRYKGASRPAVELFAALCLRTDEGMPIRPAAHHRVWLDLITDERIKQLLILAPPESAKTTWVLTAYVACWIGFHPESNVIIASSTDSIASRRSASIRNVIESATWRKMFPGIKKARGMAYTESEWSVAPLGAPFEGRIHPTLSAYGTGGSITGARADLLIGDDLLDFDNSRTPGSRDTVRGWVHNSFLTRRKSGEAPGRTIIIGTMWNANDLYGSLKNQGDFVVCKMPLLSSEPGYKAYLEYPDNWTGPMLGEFYDRMERGK